MLVEVAMALFNKRLYLIILILLLGTVVLAGPELPAQSPTLIPQEFPQSSSARAAPEHATLFTDSFDAGTSPWNLDTHWAVYNDSGDNVLDGQGHAWAWLKIGQNWTDYTFTTNVKIISGTVQLMFRFTEDHGRYILGITPGGMYLRREAPWGKISSDLKVDSTGFTFGNWYTISVETVLNHIRVSVNGVQRIYYTDPSLLNLWPQWQGTIGLEVNPDASAQAYFDDIDVYGVISPDKTWVRTGGPMGGLGYDIRFGSSTQEMFVTDNYSGVFKSSNNGQSWYPSNRGITGRFWPSGDAIPVFTLNLDVNNSNIVWAGLKDVKGVFKSTDGGNTWVDKTPDSTELPESNFVFRGFTVMPGHSNIVFAAGEIPSYPPSSDPGKLYDRVEGRVLRSDDGGDTWTSIWKGDNLARYVIVRPDNHNVIYVSTGIFDREAENSKCQLTPPLRGGVGILKGVYGDSIYAWTALTQTRGLTDLYVGSLVMHPNNPDIMLAGAGNNGCSYNTDGSMTGGVFITFDGGQSWQQTLSNDIITSVEFSPSNPNIAYAGGREHFYISHDGGRHWEMVAGQTFYWGPPGIVAGFPIDFLVDPSDPFTLFVNNYGGGAVKSIDGGVHWTLASQGYTGAQLYDVSIHPWKPGVVYTTGKNGTFRSLNGGDVWEGLTYPPADLIESYSVALKPDNPKIVLASMELGGKLYRSQDSGLSWTQVYTLTTGGSSGFHGFKRIVFSTANKDIVYAGSCVYTVALNTDATKPSYGIFKSTNSGASWQPANDSQTSDTCVNNLAIDPDNPDIVYAATAAEGLYKTTTGGISWTHLTGLSPTDIRAVAINPSNTQNIYVGTDGFGVYRSDDGGITWVALDAGMEPNDRIWAIVFDPADPRTLYAGSFLTGVYQWVINEEQWVHINLGLRTRAVTDLAISGDGKVMYASTFGEGIFRLGDIPAEMLYLPLISR
jgi:photosystem II stability/assembly factor-like uncharacterized protein